MLAAADGLRREVCGDDVTYVVTRNIQYTNVCYFRCGFCAFSKGKLAANLRGAPYLVPHDEIVRRCEEAWERGATEVCLQGGIHPAFTGDYYLVGRAARSRRRFPDLHVHAFSALEVWQGAATLGAAARRLPDGAARRGPRLAARHGRRDPRRRGAARHLPGQGHDGAVAPRARRRAPGRSALERDDHVRPRRGPAQLGAPPARMRASSSARAAASPSSCRFRSCTWRRRSGCAVRRARARRSARRCSCTPSRGSRCIRGSRTSRCRGSSSARDGVAAALRAGVNDLGGTLMNESISRSAGAEHGQEFPPEAMEELIRAAGRIPRQRTTLYGDAPEERRLGVVRRGAARRAAQPAREGRAPRRAAAARPARASRPSRRTRAGRRASRAGGSARASPSATSTAAGRGTPL